jgi:hypothetical protein
VASTYPRGVGIALVVLLILGVGILLAVLGAMAAAKRREAVAAYAASRGWTYVREQPDLVDRFPGHPFGRGFGRRATNVVHGTWDGRVFVSFDYVYKTQQSNGKTTTTVNHPFSVLAVGLGVRVPELEVAPEGIFGSIADAVSGSAINLESEEFNQAFTVRSDDRKFASDVLHPLMMEYLLAHRGLAFRTVGDSLLVVGSGHRPVEQVDGVLAWADGVLDRVPEFVWVALRGGS